MQNDKIIIKGARENNLKNVNLELPRNKLIVFTGVSGSGKSTLAFDTIFAEGQRRYMDSLSSYARQFLGQSSKPDVDSIEGLSPAISIDQKSTNHNPRSTVGTITEIYDYLRLLYSKIGKPFCPKCNKEISTQTIDQIVEKLLENEDGTKLLIVAPIIKGKKGQHKEIFESISKKGFSRILVDGKIKKLDEEIELDKNIKHSISVIVDRLTIKDGIKERLSESVEQTLNLSHGIIDVFFDNNRHEVYSTLHSCPNCGYSLEEISPRLFSFNNPYGACPNCLGLGYTMDIDENLLLKNSNLSVKGGAFNVSGWKYTYGGLCKGFFDAISKKYNIDLNEPIKNLPRKKLDIFLYGTGDEALDVYYQIGKTDKFVHAPFEGILNNLKRRFKESTSEFMKNEIEKLMKNQKCPDCHGKRLKESALTIKINGLDIAEMCDLSIEKLSEFIENIKISNYERKISEAIIKEIQSRLDFLKNVGLSYLTLSRQAETLSGGEAQRIRLATQIGSGLTGVLYILDEPSIGLHQVDNEKLLNTLFSLRNLGNTLIVVEHDEETILYADYVVDVGKYAGVHGGEIIATGSPQDIMNCPDSITGKFLSGKEKIEIPKKRRRPKGFFKISSCTENNLKGIEAKFPVGCFTCVTGVSGSGKSSLVSQTLYPILANALNRTERPEGKHGKVQGLELFDKVINIDQSPIGRTPRSNPATYTGVFTPIRELFASTQTAKVKGFTSSRFSFNIPGGRCEKCEGEGVKTIEMFFLPDVEIPCEVCEGKRYNQETLSVLYKGKNINDVLDMTVEFALDFFKNIPAIRTKLQALYDVGLGYIKLGQSSTTLSGGEAQRVKLATELAKRGTGKTLYILDEPTTGLHMYDVKKLVNILQKFVDKGNTVVVIEHNLDLIKVADYIIDLGPDGGDHGGEIVAFGSPEKVAKCENSYTGKYLKKILNKENNDR
ncbi:MAG: excinuclease ABC subunit UvrA [Christensenellales bacterium]